MNWTKSIIGEVAYMSFKESVFWEDRDSIKAPEGTRIMKGWELQRLQEEDKEAIKVFQRGGYIYCVARACRLNNFNNNSNFNAVDWDVLNLSSLRGVCLVKIKNRGKE